MTDIDFRNLKKDEWYNIGGMYYKILGKSDNLKNPDEFIKRETNHER